MRSRDEVLREFDVHGDSPRYVQERMADRIRELESQQAASEPVTITDAMVEAGCREHYEYTTGLRWDDANSTVQYMWRKDARIMLTAALTAASEGVCSACYGEREVSEHECCGNSTNGECCGQSVEVRVPCLFCGDGTVNAASEGASA